LKILSKALPWLCAALLFMAGWYFGSTDKDTEWKEVIHNEYVKKQEATQAAQLEVNRISKDYQETLAGIEGSTDRIITDLRRDNQRLRVNIKDTTGTQSSDGRCIFNGKAELDETTSRRLIGITKRGDAQIESLQNTIRELQGEKKQ